MNSNYYKSVNKHKIIMSEEITRRKLMRVGAGTAALGATGSLSGCSTIRNLIPGGGGGLGNYSNWVYAPDTFESDAEGLDTSATNYSSIYSNNNISEDARSSIASRTYDDIDIKAQDVEMELNLPEGRVLSGSFDTEAVKSELTAAPIDTPTGRRSAPAGSTEYESDGTYNDNYELYVQAEPDTSPDAYAVGNGNVIYANRVPNTGNDASEVEATEVAEGIIDCNSEGTDRLVDSNDSYSTLVDTLNSGVSVSTTLYRDEVGSDEGPDEVIGNGQFEGVVCEGSAASINGENTELQLVFVYDGEGDVNESDINDWIEANDTGALGNLNDISVSTDANTATVTGTLETILYSV